MADQPTSGAHNGKPPEANEPTVDPLPFFPVPRYVRHKKLLLPAGQPLSEAENELDARNPKEREELVNQLDALLATD